MIKLSDINQDNKYKDIPGDWHFKVLLLDFILIEYF